MTAPELVPSITIRDVTGINVFQEQGQELMTVEFLRDLDAVFLMRTDEPIAKLVLAALELHIKGEGQ